MKYTPFWRSEFEKKVNIILKKMPLQYWREAEVRPKLTEITNRIHEGWALGEIKTQEYVYKAPTSNRFVDIIIYSSVDLKTDRTRDCGEDRVRLVLRCRREGRFHYKSHKQRNRVENLFNNVKESIEAAQKIAMGWIDLVFA